MMSMKALAVALLSIFGLSSAQFNLHQLSGFWHDETTTGSAPSAASTQFGKVVGDSGVLYTVGSEGVYSYNHQLHAWSRIAHAPSAGLFAPGLAYAAGLLVMFGGDSDTGLTSSLNILNTIGVNPTWTGVKTYSSPPGRDAPATFIHNGKFHLQGGWDKNMYFQDLYTYDLSQLVEFTPTIITSWKKVSTNVPMSARNGHTACVYEDRVYFFGGFYHNTAAGASVNCDSPAQQCTFFNDLWVLTPGLQTGQVPSWSAITLDSTAPKPAGRYGHLAVMLGNYRMAVFGGTALGTSGTGSRAMNDLWMYDEHLRAWDALTPVGTAPPAMGTVLGGHIGMHMLVFPSDPSTNAVVYNYMPVDQWLTPSTSPTPVPSPTPVCAASESIKGVTASIVLSLLVIIGHIAFSVFVFVKYQKDGGSMSSGGGGGGFDYAGMPTSGDI